MAIPCLACRHLQGVGFEAAGPDELAQIESLRVEHRPFVRGAVVADRGTGAFLGTLYSGWAIEYAPDPRGLRRASRLWLPGDLLGLSSLFDGAGAAHELVTVTDATICRFTPEQLPEMLATPALAERLLRIALRQNAELAARLEALRRLPALGRLAHFLLGTYTALARRRLAHGYGFRLPLQRQQIADLLGLTPLHLRRSAMLLEREGLAVMKRDQIALLAPERLEATAGFRIAPDLPMPLL